MALIDQLLEQLRAHDPLATATHPSRPRFCAGSASEVFDALAALARGGRRLSIKQLSVMTPDRQQMIALHSRMPEAAPSPEIIRRGDALKEIRDIELHRLILTGSSEDTAELRPWADGAGVTILEISAIQHRQLFEELFDYCDYLLINDSILLVSRHIDDARQRDDWLLLPVNAIGEFNQLWQSLRAEVVSRVHVSHEIVPVWRSADFAHTLADVVCKGSHVDPRGCSWYHGSWQYLRLADKVSSPFWHEEFFRRSLKYCFSRQGSPRILVSGCADYGMLSLVVDELRRSNSASRSVVYVIDQCRTPLIMCEWLLKNLDSNHAAIADVRMIQADMHRATLESLKLDRQVDIIVTDAFLTRFQKPESEAVVKVWRNILAPTGMIITTIRVHEEANADEDRDVVLDRYAATAIRRLRPWKPFLGVPDSQLSGIVYDYGRTMRSENLGNAEQVIEMLLANALYAWDYEAADVQGELEPSRYLRLLLGTGQAPQSRKAKVETSTAPLRRPMYSSDATERAQEAIPHLYRALERQTSIDPSWAGNLGSATFAAHAHVALGDNDSWQKIARWVRGAWRINPSGLPRPAGAPSSEYTDFKEIVERTRATGGVPLDLDRFHRGYVLALLLNFEGDSRKPDEPRVRGLLAALKREVAREGTGLLYPTSVPWVTARALIGLARLQSSGLVPDTSMVNELRDSLLAHANAGWAPGTAGWNTKAQTTALVVSAVLIAGKSRTSPTIVQAIDEILARYGNEWSATIDVLDCCDCLYALALARRSLSQFSSDFLGILRWAHRVESMAIPADVLVSRGDESSKIPQVLSVLLDLIRLDASLAGSLSRLLPDDAKEGREDSAGIDERLENLVSEVSELKMTIQRRIEERKKDIARLPRPTSVLTSGLERLTKANAELDQIADEARALKTATGDRLFALRALQVRLADIDEGQRPDRESR